MKRSKAYYRGCLLGGAIGDALGYTVEFMTMEEILKIYGKKGIRDLICDQTTGKALISDDTQMTAFTTDGLVWADQKAKVKGIYSYIPCIFYAYQKWLYTQTGSFADKTYEFLLKGEILKWEELFARRAPGPTCLMSLSESINGKFGTIKHKINDKKGCGAVMRAAPVGLCFTKDPQKAFRIGAESGAITHGHPSGYLSAGLFAFIIAEIIQGIEIEEAVKAGLEELKKWDGHEELYTIMTKVLDIAKEEAEPYEALISLGQGWVGEEALAIAVYSAIRYKTDFKEAVCLAANHGGDSDSTAAICGNIMGAYLGSLEIPYKWIKEVELSDLMVHGADELLVAANSL
jgi:ADP-ribosylglycohydrolase